MDTLDFNILSVEDISEMVSRMTPEQICENISKMNLTQVKAAILKCNEDNDPEWSLKTRAAIQGLTQRELLEAAGKTFTLHQMLYYMTHVNEEKEGRAKALSLLIGLSPSIFREILPLASERHLNFLKEEAAMEPIQHHLTILTHQLSNEIVQSIEAAKNIEREISQLNPLLMNNQNILNIKEKILTLSTECRLLIEEIDLALLITWNSNRTDLIEKLSHIKENYIKYNATILGYADEPSGLYEKLETQLNRIYGNPRDPNDIEAFEDDEPVMEALSKFGFWYLEDYWKAGLLPGISSIDQLDLELKSSDKERILYREKLLSLAQKSLANIGLITVKDLKKAHIISLETLHDYIVQHTHLINQD